MTATPGHGGKECGNADWFAQRNYMLQGSSALPPYVVMDCAGHKRHVMDTLVYCPACGIKLTPDEPELPVPEGCAAVSITEISGDSALMHEIVARDGTGVRIFALQAFMRRDGIAAWRRAFGKEFR